MIAYKTKYKIDSGDVISEVEVTLTKDNEGIDNNLLQFRNKYEQDAKDNVLVIEVEEGMELNCMKKDKEIKQYEKMPDARRKDIKIS